MTFALNRRNGPAGQSVVATPDHRIPVSTREYPCVVTRSVTRRGLRRPSRSGSRTAIPRGALTEGPSYLVVSLGGFLFHVDRHTVLVPAGGPLSVARLARITVLCLIGLMVVATAAVASPRPTRSCSIARATCMRSVSVTIRCDSPPPRHGSISRLGLPIVARSPSQWDGGPWGWSIW